MDKEIAMNLLAWVGGSILIGYGTNWQVGVGVLILSWFLKSEN